MTNDIRNLHSISTKKQQFVTLLDCFLRCYINYANEETCQNPITIVMSGIITNLSRISWIPSNLGSFNFPPDGAQMKGKIRQKHKQREMKCKWHISCSCAWDETGYCHQRMELKNPRSEGPTLCSCMAIRPHTWCDLCRTETTPCIVKSPGTCTNAGFD